MMGFDRCQSAESGGRLELARADAISSANGASRTGAAATVDLARPQPFAVEVGRRGGVVIVRPHGELDLATVERLRAALDRVRVQVAGRLVLDLHGLSYMDSTGLRLLIALHQRAQRDGFQLTLVAPADPARKALQLSGLDQALPFVAAHDAVDRSPSPSTRSLRDRAR